MRAVVTGGCGFIGSHLVDRLTDGGDHVVVADLLCRTAVNTEHVAQRAFILREDVADPSDRLRDAIAEADVVYHLAAQSHVDASIRDPGEAMRTNAVGTTAVATLCAKLRKPLVYCSTDEVYGDLKGTEWEYEGADERHTPLNPSSPYSAGKAAGELSVRALCRTAGLRAVIARGCNAWGPRQVPEKLVPIACRLLQRCEQVPLHDGGEQVRQWVHVTEFARALHAMGGLAARATHGRCEAFHIAGPEQLSVRAVVARLAMAVGIDPSDAMADGGHRPGQDMVYHLSGARARQWMGLDLRGGPVLSDMAQCRGLLEAYPPDGALHTAGYSAAG